MDIPYSSEGSLIFATNVGLVTSHGPHGHDIMACEGTHHLSYSPGIIAVNIRKTKASYENIVATREFGVSIAARDQNVLSSIAGGSSGKDTDKIAALKELGFEFFVGEKTKALLVTGAAANFELKLLSIVENGDHSLLTGEVVAIHPFNGKLPLIYAAHKYFKLGEQIMKPEQAELDRITAIVAKFKKK